MAMTKKQLEEILADVEQEIGTLLKSQTSELKKAVGGEESPGGEQSPGGDASPAASPAPGGSPEGSAPAGAEASSPAPEASSAPESAESAPAPEGPAEGGAPEGPADPAALEAAYEQLPPEELKMHYLAAKSAMMKLMGGSEGAQSPEASSPAASPSPEGSAPPAMSAPAMKSELPQPKSNVPGSGSVKGNGEDPLSTKKSEEMSELKAQVETLTKALTLMLEQPLRKATTSLSAVTPVETTKDVKSMTRSEITNKLSAKCSDPKLAKSDRDLVNNYYDGKVSLEKIAHLLQ